MSCATCDELLAAYGNAVSLFKDAVEKASGASGADSFLAGIEATRLGRQCKKASNVLMEHWQVEHPGLADSTHNLLL
jgi:hypothetical protein